MSDNVVPMRPHGQARRDRDPHLVQAMHDAADKKKLERIRELYQAKSEKGLVRWSKNDVLTAAQALAKLLVTEGRVHVSINQMKEAWRKERNESELHIHRYALSQKIDLTDRNALRAARDKIKSRKVQPYAERARFIARLKGLDEDESEMSLYRDTELWHFGATDRGAENSDPYDAAGSVALLLREMGERVIRDSALDALFGRMRRVAGQWDLRSGRFNKGRMNCLFGTAYQGAYEHWTEAPPFPSVPLAMLLHANSPVRFRLTISEERYTDDLLSMPVSEDEGTDLQGHLRIWREIRLALGPTVNAQTLAPMFESRACAELWVQSDGEEYAKIGKLDIASVECLHMPKGTCSFAVSIDDGWGRATLLDDVESLEVSLAHTAAAFSGKSFESPLFWEHTPFDKDKQQVENYYMSWTPVDRAHVTHWLDRLEGDAASPADEFRLGIGSSTPCWYPYPILAHHIEHSIGDVKEALRKSVEAIREAFEAYEANWKSELEEKTEKLLSDFRSDLSPSKQD